MKVKKTFYFAIVLVILIVILSISYLLYIPPLIDGPGYNIPGRVYDYFSYVYYASLAEWGTDDDRSVRCSAAMAAWHRPYRMEELMGCPPGNLSLLGRKYAGLGLDKEADRLFQAALPSSLSDREESLRIISNLATLDNWSAAVSAARRLIEINPESVEVNYWLGRSLLEMGEVDEASVFLGEAVSRDPAHADAIYQAGRAYEKMGRRSAALSLFEKAVRVLPSHRAAWATLARIYGEEKDLESRQAAVLSLNKLTPEIPLKAVFGDRYILRGYNINQEELKTGEKLILTLFLESLFSSPGDFIPVVSLTSSGYPRRVSREGEIIPRLLPGEVSGQIFSWDIPRVIYPGSIDLEISFAEKDTGRKLKHGGREYLELTSFKLLPAWISGTARKELVKKYFGDGALSLGKGTFLGPGAELSIDLPPGEKAGGLGLVSCGHTSGSLLQGVPLGEIVVNSNDSGELILPITMGVHTAEVWWEYSPIWRTKHQQVPIYRSWPVSCGGKEFRSHEYYTVYSFPHPQAIKNILFRNLSRKSGLNILDLILIPPPQ